MYTVYYVQVVVVWLHEVIHLFDWYWIWKKEGDKFDLWVVDD